jgi:hypothetical protein
MMRTHVKTVLTVAAIGLGATAGAVAVAGSDTPSAPKPTPRATTLDPALTEGFAVFRRDRAAADELPEAALRALPGPERFDGANAELSRRTTANDVGVLYAVAGRGEVCTDLVDEAGAGGSCVPVELALAGKTVSTTQQVDGVVVSGLVPDAVDAVDVVLEDGSIVRAKVEDNGYLVKVDGAPARLRYAHGVSTVDIEIPYSAPEGEVVAGE